MVTVIGDEGGIRTSGGANVGAGSFGPGDTKLAADVDSGSNSYSKSRTTAKLCIL